jgi:hypothetical protein
MWYAPDDQENPKGESGLSSVGVARARVFADKIMVGAGFTAPSTGCAGVSQSTAAGLG